MMNTAVTTQAITTANGPDTTSQIMVLRHHGAVITSWDAGVIAAFISISLK